MFTHNNLKNIGKFGQKEGSKELLSAASDRGGAQKRTRADSTIGEGDIHENATTPRIQMEI